MGPIEKIGIALDMYRLCKVEPEWIKAWVHYKSPDPYKDYVQKENISMDQFGLVLATMKNPSSAIEIECIVGFLDEDHEYVPGSPRIVYLEHEEAQATLFDPDNFSPERKNESWVGCGFININTRGDGFFTTGFGGPIYPSVIELVSELEKLGIETDEMIINMD